MPATSSIRAKNVTVIGTGYVGLPLCVLLKRSNHKVLGYDANVEKIKSLNDGCRVCHSPERIDPGRKYPNYKDIQKVIGGIDKISTQRVCGVSYKPDIISDVRDAPQKDFIETILENNVDVRFHDPL
eukprot:Awhi_evm1s10380